MINSRKIEDLNQTVARGATELIKRMKAKGYNIGISMTYRDNEYQNYLYAQGRTRSGPVITNAKGGQSMHNYRYAFDVYNNVVGNLYPAEIINATGREWEAMGGEWGGSWKGFKDTPHMQFIAGKTDRDIIKGYRLSDSAKMKWENEVPKKPVPPTDDTFCVKIERGVFAINSKNEIIDRVILDGRNFVSLRDVCEKLGYSVDYDPVKKIPIIK